MPPQTMLFPPELCAETPDVGYEPQIAAQMNQWWTAFELYADSHFPDRCRRALSDLRRFSSVGPERDQAFYKFHQSWWEMCVAIALLENKVQLVPRHDWKSEWGTEGPDFMAKMNERIVWIECIAVLAGNKADAVPQPVIPRWDDEDTEAEPQACSSYLPEREILLRITGGIHTKRGQYKKHMTSGIIAPNDAYVIALNTNCVTPLICIGDDASIPLIAKALFGLGDLSVKYSRESRDWSEPVIGRRFTIERSEGPAIDSNTFGNGSAREVSGVLYSSISSAGCQHGSVPELLYLSNPTATTQLPISWLSKARTIEMMSDGKHCFLKSNPPVTP